MEHTVSRAATALVTVREGTDTTARAAASDELAARLEGLAVESAAVDWEITDAAVYEHPAGPFEPYTVRVSVTATAVVDAADEATAERAGTAAIDDALAAADLEELEVGGGATVEAG
ncbi:hypothetical protein [Natrononativus amylolyticus]|uniref:hypothetical protein n=1 Tax=Natrononativus amylolyticus TaxID=2963434 RepID=UPI0020CC34E9|nr:hypothetical protein [Natrononativus amylolyticus]